MKLQLFLSFICIFASTLHMKGELIIEEKTNVESEEYKNLLYEKISNNSIDIALRSIAAGSMAGTLVGMVTKKIDSSIPHIWPLSWFSAGYANDKLVKEIAKNLDENNIAYSPELLALSSWLSTWFAYLLQ